MSAQKFYPDLGRVKKVSDTNVAMLITMHAGLTEIAKCPATASGSEAMKYIAEQSLKEVKKIADTLEVVNA